jgi:hypothetical protein
MRTLLLAAMLALVTAVPAASAGVEYLPVCVGPAPNDEFGPVTISSYGINCMDVDVDHEWGPLPDDGTPHGWEGGIAECTEDGCKTLATWTCLGGVQPKIQRTTVGPLTIVVHHCTPGPHPGPAL